MEFWLVVESASEVLGWKSCTITQF